MPTTPFPNLPSGQNFIPEVSGVSFLGSAAYPFGTIWATALSGVTVGSTFSGGAITSNLTPTTSGTLTLGTAAIPFSGVYSNQYVTTYISGVQTTGSITVNWNSGLTQHMNFTNAASGVATVALSNGIAGSAYLLTTQQNISGTTSIAWGSEVIWQGGVSGTMTATSGTSDVFSFLYNGNKYLGSFSNNYY